MNVLSIGNSFSQDAQRYLHNLAEKDGFNMRTINLYIGGCSLRTHYLNMLDDEKAYGYEFNGEGTGLKVSMREVLKSCGWDIITLQQVSYASPNYSSFSPYLEELAKYVRKYVPTAKIYMHQTWAYEKNCERLDNLKMSDSQMIKCNIESYEKAAKLINADGIIKSGEAMYELSKTSTKVHRDTVHASHGLGRYLLALTWYKTLTGRNIDNIDFNNFDEEVSEEQRKLAINAVNKIVK